MRLLHRFFFLNMTQKCKFPSFVIHCSILRIVLYERLGNTRRSPVSSKTGWRRKRHAPHPSPREQTAVCIGSISPGEMQLVLLGV